MNEVPTIKISELVKSGEASLQTGPFGTQLKASDYVDEGVPVINVRNVGFGDIRQDNLEYLNERMVEKLSAHILQKNDIVFGRKGAVERHAFISNVGKGWVQGSDCLRLRIQSERINNRFVSYFFITKAQQDWMQAVCNFGATMASLNHDIVKLITLPLPPKHEQDKITAILSAYDDLIENNKRRIALLEKMAEEIYREWFVRFRFPGYQTAEFEKGIPAGWGVEQIGNVFKTYLGGTPSRDNPRLWGGDIPWINSGEVNNSRIINESEFITDEGLRGSAAKMMPKRTTVLAITGATLGQVSLTEIEVSANQSVVGVYDEKGKYNLYIFEYIKTNIESVISKQSGGGQQHINKDIVERELILLPPEDIVSLFNEKVASIYDQIVVLMNANMQLADIKEKLLPRLISGKLSVADLDIQFPPSMLDDEAA